MSLLLDMDGRPSISFDFLPGDVGASMSAMEVSEPITSPAPGRGENVLTLGENESGLGVLAFDFGDREYSA